jgi:hypothetical protein
MIAQEKIKQILVELAINDKLPMDLNDLDSSIFDEAIKPFITVLKTLREDADMALDGAWDCTTEEGIETGFTSQIQLIDTALAGEMKIEEKYIGSAAVDSGQLMICDPCYIDSEWEKEDFEDVRVYKNEHTGRTLTYPKDFKNYEDVLPEYGKTMNTLISEHDWKIADSPKAEHGFSYNACCKATLHTEERAGRLRFKLGHDGAGVVFSTAWGDGYYPVFKNYENGEFVGVTVKFQ